MEKQVKESSWPEDRPDLTVLFETGDFIFFAKPAGLLTQKAGTEDVSANDWLLHHCGTDASVTPSVVNRLDRNTSGILAGGKTLYGLQTLSELIRDRRVEKKYEAIVLGTVTEGKRLTGWLSKDKKTNQVTVTEEQTAGASEVITEYEPLLTGHGVSLVRLNLITGKTHQIRAQMAADGHPLIGDSKYGISGKNREYAARFGVRSMMLHAGQMTFPEFDGADERLMPLSGRVITADRPEAFEKAVRRLFDV